MKTRLIPFILWGSAVFFGVLALNTALFCIVLAPGEGFFRGLAAALVLSWAMILTLYYIWAIYYYTIRKKTHRRDAPAAVVPAEWTLGLPPGTVRGTIALTVLVSGMAMMIATLAAPDTIQDGSLPIDHFEFLKTAFLMVIAFYFGSKSLEILTDRKGHTPKSERPAESASEGSAATPQP